MYLYVYLTQNNHENSCRQRLVYTNVQQFFSQYESIYATRQNYTFTQEYTRTDIKSTSLSIKGVQLTNCLSEYSSLKQ